jgi:hypothetical protein
VRELTGDDVALVRTGVGVALLESDSLVVPRRAIIPASRPAAAI